MTKKADARKQAMRDTQAKARALVLSIFKLDRGPETQTKLTAWRVLQHARARAERGSTPLKQFDGLVLWALDNLVSTGEIEDLTSVVERVGAMGRGERVDSRLQVYRYPPGKTTPGVSDAT